ncbi:MAG: iron ABC transporter permease [Gammaproteobacteria bacterium]|nr:iron ABC transporter permease [Gammaproteobacteria bacterium]MBU1647684.1 iron ABC transporter permease [Gammaproteobacteria bacterium]MBU1971830.1 iron ABC transporter permease [Gammaproteobacteria bacterium]
MRPALFLPLLFFAAVASFVLALAAGSQGLEPAVAWQALLGDADSLEREVILGLRLPRALAAFGCGALLALAGAMLQALLRNPLADPFVLGISGGAGAMVLLAMLAGLSGLLLAGAGLAGALLSLAVLLALAWRGGLLPHRLLLAGVILSSAWGALVTLILALAPDAPLRGMVFWLMGDLSGVDPANAALPPLAAVLALLLAWPLARGFDALGQGETAARALGVAVGRLRAGALLLAAAMTTLAVLAAGSIGFVGLVTPHVLRLAGLRRHRLLLPGCVLAGGTLLLLADLAARTIAAPRQLPVGAVTAAIGAPLFLWLLARERR